MPSTTANSAALVAGGGYPPPGPLQRVPTFIGGLDELMQGGIPRGYVVLVAGRPGSLKSTVAFNILYQLANQRNEPVLYVTLEQEATDVFQQMRGFGLQWEGVRKVMTIDLSALKATNDEGDQLVRMDWFKAVLQTVRANHAQFGLSAVVIDSLNALYQYAFDGELRTQLLSFFHELRALRATTFLLTEMRGGDDIYGSQGSESFLADGIIHLDLRRDGLKVGRYIGVPKMRATKHSTDYYPLIADERGFRIVVR